MKNCEDTTQDIERSSFVRLSLKDRVGMRMHLSLCKDCRRYFKDSKAIDRLLKKRFTHLSKYSFTKEEKEDLKRKIVS
jgi:hypothetical protein